MRPLKYFFATVAFLFAVQCYSQSKLENTLLWKISGKNLTKPSYLYGTMHVKDPKMFNFSDSVLIAFKAADKLALELQMDSITDFIMPMMFDSYFQTSKKTKAVEYFTSDEIKILDKKLKAKLGISYHDLSNKSPFIIYSLLNRPKADTSDKEEFLDLYLFKLAKYSSKPVAGLEYFSEQMKFFSDTNQVFWKREILASGDEDEALDSLKNIYVREDLNAIAEMNAQSIKNEPKYYEFITLRNITMRNRSLPLISQGSTFIAVGAAHLPGDSGLINLFRLSGYTVEPVKRVYTGIAKKIDDELSSSKKSYYEPYKYENANSGYKVEFPTKPVAINLMPGIDFQIALDPITFTSGFMTISGVDNIGVTGNFASIMQKMLTKNADTSEGVDAVSFKFKGLDAQKTKFNSDDAYYSALTLKKSNNQFYALIAFSQKNDISEISQKFFDSFDTLKMEAAQWKRYDYPDDACSLEFPSAPVIHNSLTENNDSYSFKSLACEENASGNSFILQTLNYKQDIFTRNDSLILKSYDSTMNALFKESVISSQSFCEITDGCNSYNIKLYTKNGTTYRFKAIPRLQRIYLLHGEVKNADSALLDRYFNSFKMIDVESKLQEKNIFGMSLNLPFKEDISPDKDNSIYNFWSYYDTTQNATRSYNSSMIFVFTRNQYSKYYQSEGESQFFNKIDSTYITRYDAKKISSKIEKKNDAISYTFSLKFNKCNSIIKGKAILVGRNLYMTHVLLSERDANNPLIDEIFASMKVESPNLDGGNVFSNKLSLIFNGIESDDSAALGKKTAVLFSFPSALMPLDTLKKYLTNDKMSESEILKGFRYALLTQLNMKQNAETYSFINEKFDEIAPETDLKFNLLNMILSYRNEGAYREYFKRINALETPDSLINSTWQAFGNFFDSLSYTARYANEIKAITKNPAFKIPAYALLSTLLDSNYIDKNFFADIESQLVKDIKAEKINLAEEKMDNAETNGDTDDEDNDNPASGIESMIDILAATAKRPESISYLKSLLNGAEDIDVVLASFSALLKNDYEIESSQIKNLAASPILRSNIYEALDDNGKLALFPFEYKNQKSIAESSLIDMINYAMGIKCDSVHLVKICDRTIDDKKATFYVYSFDVVDSSGANKKAVGYAGPYYFENIKIETRVKMTGSSLQEYNAQHIDALLDEYLESFKDSDNND